jgi:hypothetical protein
MNNLCSRSPEYFPQRCRPCVPLWLVALCGYCDPRPEGRASLLTLTNRMNTTGFGFVPYVIFSVGSAAKRAVIISGVAAGIGLVPNSQHPAKFQVCSHSRIFAAFSDTDAFPQSPSPRYLRRPRLLLSLLSAPDFLHFFPDRGTGHSAIPPIWPTLDRACL